MNQKHSHPISAKGLAFMTAASVCFSMMGILVFWAGKTETRISAMGVSFVRIAVNLGLCYIFALLTNTTHILRNTNMWSKPLWLRGIFGSVALFLGFAAVFMIGLGESSFLAAANAVFVALLAPAFLKQKNNALTWIGIIGSLVGLYFLFQPRLDDVDPMGRVLALGGAFFSSLAFISMSKAGRTHAPNTIVFYFCLVGTIFHLALFPFVDIVWPVGLKAWSLLLGGGVFASIAQHFMTIAYQHNPAAINALIGYITPVLNLLLEALIFDDVPDSKSLLGAAIVLFFGMMLPVAQLRQIGLRAKGRKSLPMIE